MRTAASRAAGEQQCCSDLLGVRLNPLPVVSWCLRAMICPGSSSLAVLRQPWSLPTPCLDSTDSVSGDLGCPVLRNVTGFPCSSLTPFKEWQGGGGGNHLNSQELVTITFFCVEFHTCGLSADSITAVSKEPTPGRTEIPQHRFKIKLPTIARSSLVWLTLGSFPPGFTVLQEHSCCCSLSSLPAMEGESSSCLQI